MRAKYTKLAILLSLSIVLSFFKLPIFPYAPFLTLDLSLLPIILACSIFSYSTSIGVLVARFVILTLFQGLSLPVLIGSLSDTLAGLCLITFQTLITNKSNILKNLIIIIITTVVMTLANYWLIFPLYASVLNTKLPHILIWIAIVPFNIIKSFILLTLTTLLAKRKII